MRRSTEVRFLAFFAVFMLFLGYFIVTGIASCNAKGMGWIVQDKAIPPVLCVPKEWTP